MRYSTEPGNRIYVKGYGFMSFARSMSNKYGNKLVDTAKTSATEATGDLIGNKIADKISVYKKKSNNNNNDNVELSIHKKRYMSPEERQQIIDELRLVPKNY